MILRCVVLAVTASLTMVAGATGADAAWQTYSNPAYAFAIETPAAPVLKTASTQITGKTITALTGSISLGTRGGLVFTVTDFSSLVQGAMPSAADADVALDNAVQSSVTSMQGSIENETKIVVDGGPGREATIKIGDRAIAQERAVMHGTHLYILIGVGPAADGVPPEYARFEKSLQMQ